MQNQSTVKVHPSDISAPCSWCPLHKALEGGEERQEGNTCSPGSATSSGRMKKEKEKKMWRGGRDQI